jgi:hypothetical protein
MPVNIPIHVETASGPAGPAANQFQAGTFTNPFPLTRVKQGREVQWEYTGPFDSFTVQFKTTSPFPGISAITRNAPGPTPAQPAQNLGRHHYTISVTVGGVTWTIGGCPELGVDP